MKEALDKEGFAIVPGVLPVENVSTLVRLLSGDAFAGSPGIRQIASRSPELAALARSKAVADLVTAVLGEPGRLVRSIYFDKSASVNWKVTWHQDLTIAVRSRENVEGFGPWSIKDGLPHVQPPLEILEQMITIRLHLDDADELNGALRVIPGSHRYGKLSASEAANKASKETSVTCTLQAGDALLMKPHILHSSKKSIDPRPRRVLHFEYCSAALPEPLEWVE